MLEHLVGDELAYRLEIATAIGGLQGNEALLRFAEKPVDVEPFGNVRRKLATEIRQALADRHLRWRRRGDRLLAKASVLQLLESGLRPGLPERASEQGENGDRCSSDQYYRNDRPELLTEKRSEPQPCR